ncbi:hypothetical protein GCM10020366_03470 [Saccharopolyspora gregorii]|uniref:Uncharacterized protein n=1 Tax=Saccharopolyspora gregorii TaxID=33914 RepID=A0ABP6RNZ0_9PSEU
MPIRCEAFCLLGPENPDQASGPECSCSEFLFFIKGGPCGPPACCMRAPPSRGRRACGWRRSRRPPTSGAQKEGRRPGTTQGRVMSEAEIALDVAGLDAGSADVAGVDVVHRAVEAGPNEVE